jgi:hypothetical protein
MKPICIVPLGDKDHIYLIPEGEYYSKAFAVNDIKSKTKFKIKSLIYKYIAQNEAKEVRVFNKLSNPSLIDKKLYEKTMDYFSKIDSNDMMKAFKKDEKLIRS